MISFLTKMQKWSSQILQKFPTAARYFHAWFPLQNMFQRPKSVAKIRLRQATFFLSLKYKCFGIIPRASLRTKHPCSVYWGLRISLESAAEAGYLWWFRMRIGVTDIGATHVLAQHESTVTGSASRGGWTNSTRCPVRWGRNQVNDLALRECPTCWLFLTAKTEYSTLLWPGRTSSCSKLIVFTQSQMYFWRFSLLSLSHTPPGVGGCPETICL